MDKMNGTDVKTEEKKSKSAGIAGYDFMDVLGIWVVSGELMAFQLKKEEGS